jgi:hypothetical protein
VCIINKVSPYSLGSHSILLLFGSSDSENHDDHDDVKTFSFGLGYVEKNDDRFVHDPFFI